MTHNVRVACRVTHNLLSAGDSEKHKFMLHSNYVFACYPFNLDVSVVSTCVPFGGQIDRIEQAV